MELQAGDETRSAPRVMTRERMRARRWNGSAPAPPSSR